MSAERARGEAPSRATTTQETRTTRHRRRRRPPPPHPRRPARSSFTAASAGCITLCSARGPTRVGRGRLRRQPSRKRRLRAQLRCSSAAAQPPELPRRAHRQVRRVALAHVPAVPALHPPGPPARRRRRAIPSFLRILDEMPNLRTPPTHVLVENVVGFETSEMRDVMLETFRRLGFTTKERVLTPRMFGVPYSRPRYFCLAKRAPLRWVDGFDERDAERGPIRAPPPSRLSHPSR